MQEPNVIIKEALSAAVIEVNQGSTPTKALAKVASEYDLGPDYVQRVGEALNVALAFRHFKHAKDRSSHYKIANIPEVVATAYDKPEQSPQQEKSSNFKSSALVDKIPNYEKIMFNPRYKRAQQEILAAAETGSVTKFATTLDGLQTKAAKYIDRLKLACDQASSEKVSAEQSMNQSFADLVNHFSKTSHVRTPWHEIESQVFSKHGEASLEHLEHIYKTAGLKEDRGVQSKDYLFFNQCKEAKMFDKLVESCNRYCQAEILQKDAEHNLAFERDFYREIMKESSTLKKSNDLTTPVDAPIAPEPVKEPSQDDAYQVDPEVEKIALNLLDILSHKFNDAVETKNQDKPNIMANTSSDNLQRTMVLQELIMTDPLLSKEPPGKVAAAYQQLLRVAPEVSKEKEVVRSLLRQLMATQALDPHTSNMLTEADINLMKQKLMHSGRTPDNK